MLNILADDFSSFPFKEEIARDIAIREKSILLVPEQIALATEEAVAKFFPAHAPLCFEVSNFSRLADRVFRAEGGISYRYADRAAECILMWKVLDSAAPFLLRKKEGSIDAVKETLAAMAELSAAGLSPEKLRRAAALTQKGTLCDKLSDLALITELFEGEREEIYGSLSADLDKLLSHLAEKPLFADTKIYAFGFTSFTAKELAVLGELARQTTLSVALPLPEEGERSLCYEEVLATRAALLSLAERVGSEVTHLSPLKTTRPAMLDYAKRHLFSTRADVPVYEGEDDGSLSFLSAADLYEGCAHVAAMIASAVRGGARYRDFTVITRAPEKYDGILDDAFSAEKISYFFSKKTDITEFSLSKMILSAYACLARGFSRTDLIAYMKCGFSGIDKEDCDLFEMYTEKWKLRARAFSTDIPFDMNPDGYTEIFTEEARERLSRINEVRRRLLSPLWALAKETEGALSAKEESAALYRFLSSLCVEERLYHRAKEERRQGREAEAERISRVVSVIYDLLDRICEIMGELPITRTRFADLLALLFSSVSLDTIPTSMDAVTVRDADTFRPTGERTVVLLGAVEGEFPAAISLGGVFLEEERRTLEELGVAVGKSPELRASREQFSFLRGIAAPHTHVMAVTFGANAFGEGLRPCAAYRRLKKMFPTVPEHSGMPDAFAPTAALLQLFDRKGTAEGEAVDALLSDDPDYQRYKTLSDTPLFDPHCQVDEKHAARLFPDDMRASQSKIEGYLNCPFAYYCRRALLLEEDEPAAIRTVEVGNIIHAILERFFAALTERQTDIHGVDPGEIPDIVAKVAAAYLEELCPRSMRESPRLSHLFSRVCRAATLVCKDIYDEFAHSNFSPLFCELALEDADGPGALCFRDKDGKTVSIGGRIDRVDTYRAENGELFVRVVDYKTGSRSFSRENLKKARNLQMFVYLCAIWKSENNAFLSRLSLTEGEHPLPAGIVYNTANPQAVSLAAPIDEAALFQKIRKEHLARHGFFLAEESVIAAMDDDLSHLPITRDKEGKINFGKKNLFGSLVEFGEMLDDTEQAVLATARRMRSGCADIAPDDTVNPCVYCPYRSVCRIENVKERAF